MLTAFTRRSGTPASASSPSTPSLAESPKVVYPNTANDYELREQIGKGTAGAVYRSWCAKLKLEVAIKIIDLEWFQVKIEDIYRELTVMKLSSHPNAVPVLACFVHGNDLWMVMPLLSGGSVASLMQILFPTGLQEPFVKYIIYEAAKGLEYFHRNGQMHRDVKAANILLDANGAVMVSDYGVMGWMVEGGMERKQRQTFVGTPCWMAPEVMEQTHGYNLKADVWSLAITAIELAQGKAPYKNFPAMKVMMMVLSSEPPSLSKKTAQNFSVGFHEFLRYCLVKDPKARPDIRQVLNHKYFSSVSKPDGLPELVRSLPPLGSRGQSQQQLYRQLQRMRAGPQSGVFERIKRGSGWDFQDSSSEEESDDDDSDDDSNDDSDSNDNNSDGDEEDKNKDSEQKPKFQVAPGDSNPGTSESNVERRRTFPLAPAADRTEVSKFTVRDFSESDPRLNPSIDMESSSDEHLIQTTSNSHQIPVTTANDPTTAQDTGNTHISKFSVVKSNSVMGVNKTLAPNRFAVEDVRRSDPEFPSANTINQSRGKFIVSDVPSPDNQSKRSHDGSVETSSPISIGSSKLPSYTSGRFVVQNVSDPNSIIAESPLSGEASKAHPYIQKKFTVQDSVEQSLNPSPDEATETTNAESGELVKRQSRFQVQNILNSTSKDSQDGLAVAEGPEKEGNSTRQSKFQVQDIRDFNSKAIHEEGSELGRRSTESSRRISKFQVQDTDDSSSKYYNYHTESGPVSPRSGDISKIAFSARMKFLADHQMTKVLSVGKFQVTGSDDAESLSKSYYGGSDGVQKTTIANEDKLNKVPSTSKFLVSEIEDTSKIAGLSTPNDRRRGVIHTKTHGVEFPTASPMEGRRRNFVVFEGLGPPHSQEGSRTGNKDCPNTPKTGGIQKRVSNDETWSSPPASKINPSRVVIGKPPRTSTTRARFEVVEPGASQSVHGGSAFVKAPPTNDSIHGSHTLSLPSMPRIASSESIDGGAENHGPFNLMKLLHEQFTELMKENENLRKEVQNLKTYVEHVNSAIKNGNASDLGISPYEFS